MDTSVKFLIGIVLVINAILLLLSSYFWGYRVSRRRGLSKKQAIIKEIKYVVFIAALVFLWGLYSI